MLELWERCGGALQNETVAYENEWEIKKEKISLRKHGLKKYILWNPIICPGSFTYRIYEHGNRGKIIHESYVIHKCYKFPFLLGNDIEIGPCYTQEEWRGRGIYAYVLNKINIRELSARDKSYMIIDSKNISSIKGVKKAGYVKNSEVGKSRIFRIYHAL